MTLKELLVNNPDGFTYSLADQGLVTFPAGYQVAITDHKAHDYFLDKDSKHMLKTFNFLQKMMPNITIYLGGWKDEEVYCIDFSIHVADRTEAMMVARAFKQASIYDWENKICLHILASTPNKPQPINLKCCNCEWATMEDKDNPIFSCPNCKVEDYLMDLPNGNVDSLREKLITLVEECQSTNNDPLDIITSYAEQIINSDY